VIVVAAAIAIVVVKSAVAFGARGFWCYFSEVGHVGLKPSVMLTADRGIWEEQWILLTEIGNELANTRRILAIDNSGS
jgi:hypothetical protein